jgi:uncharacterized phage protein (TIGR01671 family)
MARVKIRELKFRGWDEDYNKMVYEHSDTNFSFISSADIIKKYNLVMQYTGLKDKKGIDIFEGDILKTKSGQIGICEFSIFAHNNSSGFVVRPKNDDVGVYFNPDICNFEIIGNIYENKDLLK